MRMNKYYFTFPQKSSLRNAYMVVEADDIMKARAIMIEAYGKPIYAFSYTEDDFLPQIEKYRLYEIPFGYMPEDEDDDQQ